MTLEGERTEMKPNFFLYIADVEVDGKKQKKYSFWNATDDTQFKATFTFGEPEFIVPLNASVTQKEGDAYLISLYPGEAKEFIRGRFKSSKRGLAFGAPDKAWQDMKAQEQTKEIEVETLAVRAALKANPSKDGRYTADYIASVCIRVGIPFVDLTFPPKNVSLFREFEEAGCALKGKVLPWKRPADYCPKGKTPALYVGTIEPADIDQGELGNCYFLTALACVAEFPKIIVNMLNVPREPELGIYRMRMCKNGWWQTITVDDLLPMKNDLPIFAKNREEPNELWVSLFEKSYAKLHGSYEAIRKGDAALAVADFFGTPYVKVKDLKFFDDKDKVFEYLLKCDQEAACMTLGTPGIDPKGAGGKMTPEQVALSDKYAKAGLVTGHAFSLIAVKRYKNHRLICVRNPWGGEHEWTGKYSDKDDCWKDKEMATALNFTNEADGSFWMPYDEMWNYFDSASVSHLKCITGYSSVRVAGNYDKGIPDVVVKVTVGGSKPVNLFTGLHQKDTRGLRPGDKDAKYLGYMISIVKQGADGKCTIVEKSSDAYVIARDIFVHDCTLAPAPPSEPYFIIPQCYSDDDKSFVLSLFLSHTDNISVEFVGYKEGLGKKINNAALFAPANCSQKVAAQIQYTQTQMCGEWCEAESNSVDFAGAMKAIQAKPKLAGRLSNDVDVTRVHAAQARAAAMGAKAAAEGAAAGNLSVKVTCISGHGLKAMDANGLSDPYLVVAVRDKTGKTRGDVEAQSTKYIPKTLDPTWGDVFVFDGIASDDQFFVQCYDKDLVQGDDALGTVVVPVASLGLKKGAGGKVADFDLTGGAGKVKLMFSL